MLVAPPRPTNYEAVSIVLTAPRFFRYIFIVREIDDGKMKDVVLRGTRSCQKRRGEKEHELSQNNKHILLVIILVVVMLSTECEGGCCGWVGCGGWAISGTEICRFECLLSSRKISRIAFLCMRCPAAHLEIEQAVDVHDNQPCSARKMEGWRVDSHGEAEWKDRSMFGGIRQIDDSGCWAYHCDRSLQRT